MKIEHIKTPEADIAVVYSPVPVITDAQSAMELAMSVKYDLGTADIAIEKRAVCGEFFILSTGVAGEILQKYVNYHIRLAIFGDFSRYTSKPLHDFIYESNKGRDFYFAATEDEAVRRLSSPGSIGCD